MGNDDALTNKTFRGGDNRRRLREHSDKASRTMIIGSLIRQQQSVHGKDSPGIQPLESSPARIRPHPPSLSHWSNDYHCHSALPMKTHWSMSARLSANRGSVWLSEGVFGIGFEDLISSGQVRMRQSISGFGIGNHGDCRWRSADCESVVCHRTIVSMMKN